MELDAVLRAADLVKPSKSASRELVPEAGSDPLAQAKALRARLGSRAVVVTDGEAGCAVSAEGFEGCVQFFAAARHKARTGVHGED